MNGADAKEKPGEGRPGAPAISKARRYRAPIDAKDVDAILDYLVSIKGMN